MLEQEKPLWIMPEEKRHETPLYRFIRWCEARHATKFDDYDAFN